MDFLNTIMEWINRKTKNMGLFDQIICRNYEHELEMSKHRNSNIVLSYWSYGDKNYCKICDYDDTINGCDYSAVIYKSGCITITKAISKDVISFDFSGCYMASFRVGNDRFVAHIAYGDVWGYKAAEGWNNLINRGIITNVRIFNPSKSIDIEKGPYNNLWGIISAREEFYAIRVYCNKSIVFVDPNGIFLAHPILDKDVILTI